MGGYGRQNDFVSGNKKVIMFERILYDLFCFGSANFRFEFVSSHSNSNLVLLMWIIRLPLNFIERDISLFYH